MARLRSIRTPLGHHWITTKGSRYPRRHLAVRGRRQPLCGATAALGWRTTTDHGLRACRNCEAIHRARYAAA